MRSRRVLTPASSLKRRLLRLHDGLLRRYGPQGEWPARSRREGVIRAILTHGTPGVNVERVLSRLRERRVLSVEGLRVLPGRRIASALGPSGSHKAEAGRLAALIRHLARHHRGSLGRLLAQPAAVLRAELSRISGIGLETADAILLHGAGRPIFVVDATTRRVLARHRIVPPDIGREALRATLMETLPRDPWLYQGFHALLARVGEAHCRAAPRCAGCPLRFDLRGRRPRSGL
jgi:endonuclease-3 related protein